MRVEPSALPRGRTPVAGPDPKDPPGGGTDVRDKTATDTRTDKPRLHKCVVHNDDYTTMEFVVEVLIEVFRLSRVEATRVMLMVHQSGKGVAGVYTREVAEEKAEKAIARARGAGFPLLVTTEPE